MDVGKGSVEVRVEEGIGDRERERDVVRLGEVNLLGDPRGG